ncbi:MAG: DNA methyltransferase, partial [Candidatus Paceibacterota bacterium]
KADFEVTEPYAADVSEGKNNPIYNAHSYHTKVPHPAIMRYILHYTQPGDIVFDGFAGTGMTGVAASMCGNPEAEFRYTLEKENSKVKWGKRNAICGDLSPAATYISYNLNNVFHNPDQFKRKIKEVKAKYDWMFKTKHSGNQFGDIQYTVWSEVVICDNCQHEISFMDLFVKIGEGEILDEAQCTNCSTTIHRSRINRKTKTVIDQVTGETIKIIVSLPFIICYKYSGRRFFKSPDNQDLELIEKIESEKVNSFVPIELLVDGDKMTDPRNKFIDKVHKFYSHRTLIILSVLWNKATLHEKFFLTNSISRNLTKLNRFIVNKHNPNGRINGPLSGTFYIPSEVVEQNPFDIIDYKLFTSHINIGSQSLFCGSATNLPNIKSDTIDYVFIDPPFGANIMYSELNFITESWLKVRTNNTKEAIENKTQKKSQLGYQSLMFDSLREFYRILKPGKWMTVEFSNTNAGIWNCIQTAISNSGFIICNVSALDKVHGGIKSMRYTTSVKQDLIITCYKPSSEFDQKFNQHKQSDVGVWEFVAEHLEHLPIHLVSGNSTTAIIERSPKILFDRLIAFYVQRSLPVPIDAGKFQQGLRERFIERDGMFFTNEQVQEYDRKKAAVPNFVQLSIFVANEQDAIYWLRHILEGAPKTEQDLHPLWMKEVAGNMRKGDTLPEMRTILEENFLKNDKGQWYLPDPENEADLEKLRTKRLLKQFEAYKTEASKPKGKIKEARVEALRSGFKHCYQEKDFKTIVQIGDRIPNNLLMEDEVLLQFYDIASSRV